MKVATRIYAPKAAGLLCMRTGPNLIPRPVQSRLFSVFAMQGLNKAIVELSTHTEAHSDAPCHFFGHVKTTYRISLGTCIRPATSLDLRAVRQRITWFVAASQSSTWTSCVSWLQR